MMVNAKYEFLKEIKNKHVLCAELQYPENTYIVLRSGYSKEDFNTFLEKLDFEYYNGCGDQELYGFIWYVDGTWSEREEYDGAEWWRHVVRPTPSEEVMKKDYQEI